MNKLLPECNKETTISRNKLIIGNKNIDKLIIKQEILKIISLEIIKKNKNLTVWSKIKIINMRNLEHSMQDLNLKLEGKMNYKLLFKNNRIISLA